MLKIQKNTKTIYKIFIYTFLSSLILQSCSPPKDIPQHNTTEEQKSTNLSPPATQPKKTKKICTLEENNIPCTNDSECYEICQFYYCIDSKCANMRCKTKEDCPHKWPCRPNGLCMRTHRPCIDDTDCDLGLECQSDGRCTGIPKCRTETDCFPGQICFRLDQTKLEELGICVRPEDLREPPPVKDASP